MTNKKLESRSKAYLDQYLNSLPTKEKQKYTSFSSDYFCADENNANVCAELVRRGEKTASCSMDYWYSQENEQMPAVGHLQVVTSWYGDPICVIEFTSISQCKYKDVTPEFAAAEGEGDKSLSWWRNAHWEYFSVECKEIRIEPSEDMLLVLERFHMVWKNGL